MRLGAVAMARFTRVLDRTNFLGIIREMRERSKRLPVGAASNYAL